MVAKSNVLGASRCVGARWVLSAIVEGRFIKECELSARESSSSAPERAVRTGSSWKLSGPRHDRRLAPDFAASHPRCMILPTALRIGRISVPDFTTKSSTNENCSIVHPHGDAASVTP